MRIINNLAWKTMINKKINDLIIIIKINNIIINIL